MLPEEDVPVAIEGSNFVLDVELCYHGDRYKAEQADRRDNR